MRSALLANIASLEQQLKGLIGAAKDHAVQAQYGKEEAREETRRHLQECGDDFLATLDLLRPSSAKAASGATTTTTTTSGGKGNKRGDYRSSVLLAKSALDSAISDLSQMAGSQRASTIEKNQFYDDLDDIVDTFSGDT